jgi:hypothetical protein
MRTPLKAIPKFENEGEERAFWESHGNDSTEYFDWDKAKLASFPRLKPSTQTISICTPEEMHVGDV